MNKRLPISVALAAALMVGSLGLSQAIKPTVYVADIKPKMDLEVLIPKEFGVWKAVTNIRPALPDPTMAAVIEATYSQTITRGYMDDQGNLLMLIIAYGADQNSEATAAHRPEFCYRGNGFDIKDIGTAEVDLVSHNLLTRRLIGTRDQYVENVAYWVTLDETATLPGLGRKLAALQYGLRGQIADGMLVRVSTPESQQGREGSFALQQSFLRDLFEHVPPQFRARIFGVGTGS
jgi:EpsI family protein